VAAEVIAGAVAQAEFADGTGLTSVLAAWLEMVWAVVFIDDEAAEDVDADIIAAKPNNGDDEDEDEDEDEDDAEEEDVLDDELAGSKDDEEYDVTMAADVDEDDVEYGLPCILI
jgi:hypothetical protein